MKTIKTGKVELLLPRLHKEANRLEVFNDIDKPYLSYFVGTDTFRLYLPYPCELIAPLKDITEEQAKELVLCFPVGVNLFYPDYSKENSCAMVDTALECLNLLMAKNECFVNNPFGEYKEALKRHITSGAWEKAEQSTRNWIVLKKITEMTKHKSLTFDKAGQDALPQHVKDKMKANQEKTRIDIEVGKVYQSVNGAKVKIHHVDEPNQYPFLATVEYIDGTYFIPTKETQPVSYSYNGQSNRSYRGFDITGLWYGGELRMYVPTETPFQGSVLQKEIQNMSNELRLKTFANIEKNILSKKVSKFWSDAADLLASLCGR